jgi:hypothetical protein
MYAITHYIMYFYSIFCLLRDKNYQQSYRYIVFNPAFPPAVVEITSKIETKFLALP